MADRARLESWDKKYLWHPFTQHAAWEKEPLFIVRRGKGATLTDIHGHTVIDGVSSLWVNLHGHGHPKLNRAVKKQLSQIAHATFLGLSHEPAIRLGRCLARISPRGLTRTFYSDNGATAVEVALKMAFQYWIEKGKKGRNEFLALQGSYHGDTIGSVSVGGIGSFHSKFGPLLFKTHFAMAPHCPSCPFNRTGARHRFRHGRRISVVPRPGMKRKETGCRWECLGDVEKKLKKNSKRTAAAVLEPVIQGAAGMMVQPEGYAAGFDRLCKKYGVLLIADEVATGFGRTGTLFASSQEKMRPDFLCLAKGITGGMSPLAATLTSESIFKAFLGPFDRNRTFFHGHSYTGHPLGAAAALENINILTQPHFFKQLKKKIRLCTAELRRLSEHPHVKSVRQAGLMMGIQLTSDKPGAGANLCQRLLKNGIWLRPLGNTLVIMPPYIINTSQIHRIFNSLNLILS